MKNDKRLETLQDAFGLLDEELIRDADTVDPPAKRVGIRMRRYVLPAAVIALLLYSILLTVSLLASRQTPAEGSGSSHGGAEPSHGGSETSSVPWEESSEPIRSGFSAEHIASGRDTVLEPVMTFHTGPDGLFPYLLADSSGQTELRTADAACADAEGNLYVAPASRPGYLYRVNDGTVLSYGELGLGSPVELRDLGEVLALRFENGQVLTIDPTTGNFHSYYPPASLRMQDVPCFLYTLDGREPLLFLCDGSACYTMSGSALSGDAVPVQATADAASGEMTVLYQGGEILLPPFAGNAAGQRGAIRFLGSKGLLCETFREKNSGTNPRYGYAYEGIYRLYDANGILSASFKRTEVTDSRRSYPLSAVSPDGTVHTLDSYRTISFTLGSNTLEGVLADRLLCGTDGTLYLLLFYPDRGTVYRVYPGKEEAAFTDLTEPAV